MERAVFIRVCVATAMLCLPATPLFAQFRSSIEGKVSDTTNAVVGAAEVTLTNTETGVTQVTHSNDQGYYRFSTLPPGLYTLTASKQGFLSLIHI